MTAASSSFRRPRPKHSLLAWLVLLLLAAAMLAMIVIPVYLIMPFKSQTPRALDISFQLKRWSPFATAIGRCVNIDPHGVREPLAFRLTMGLRKIDGSWRVMHEHHSLPAA